MPEGRKRRSDRHPLTPKDTQPEMLPPGLVRPPIVEPYREIHAPYQHPEDEGSPSQTPRENVPRIEDEQSPKLPVRAWDATLSRRRFGPYHLVFLLCVLILSVMLSFVVRWASKAGPFEQRLAFMQRNIIFDGLSVDGMSISGLTKQQALEKVQGPDAEQAFMLQVQVDGTSYTLTEKEISYGRDARDVIDAAYAVGRQGFSWGIGTDTAPFDIRYEHTRYIASTGKDYQTQGAYSKESLRFVAKQLSDAFSREAVDAQIASFDFSTRSFSVTQDAAGAVLDEQTVYDALSKALDRGQTQGSIQLYTVPIMPALTAVELQNSLRLISSFSTRTSSDMPRNENITLAASAIHGLAILPGESFSFNAVVGERTAQRGYQMAPAIAGGQTVDEIGGGVCQVSSTLFCAAAMADMSIIARQPHAWPSNYVDMGLDATVNWPNLDFAFQNNTAGPVFIVTDFRDRNLTVAFYGLRADVGEEVRLETELLASIPPPSEASYRRNENLMPGTQQEIKKARTGYQVDTYRVYLREGLVYRREKLFSSNYPMVQQMIEYN